MCLSPFGLLVWVKLVRSVNVGQSVILPDFSLTHGAKIREHILPPSLTSLLWCLLGYVSINVTLEMAALEATFALGCHYISVFNEISDTDGIR